MWEFFEIVLAIVVAVWLLDQEPPPRRGVLRLVERDETLADSGGEPSARVPARRLW
jgi:hypothetical protein